MSDAAAAGPTGPPGFRLFRERVGHWLMMHREALQGFLWGALAGSVVLAFGMRFDLGSRSGVAEFYPILALIAFALAFINRVGSLVATAAALVIEGALYYPELGCAVAVAMLVVLGLSIFGRFEALLVLSAPLLAVWTPLAIPILAGFLLGRQKGAMWSALAFVSAYAYGILAGLPRLGLEGNPALLKTMAAGYGAENVQAAVERVFARLDLAGFVDQPVGPE